MTRGFLDGDPRQPMRLTDIPAEVIRETGKAWLVFDGAQEVWLPKSQAENNGDGTFTLPEWMATEKGLL